jgi:hypothetical protein
MPGLVTSRNRLTGLAAAEGAHPDPPRRADSSESRDLLTLHLGAERALAEPVAVSELNALCGGLPLALCDVAARAVASQPPAGSARGRDAGRAEAAGRTGDGGVSHQRTDGFLLVAGQTEGSRIANVPSAGNSPGPEYHGFGGGQPHGPAARAGGSSVG